MTAVTYSGVNKLSKLFYLQHNERKINLTRLIKKERRGDGILFMRYQQSSAVRLPASLF